MGSDATEAALGLLGLNARSIHFDSSPNTGMAVDLPASRSTLSTSSTSRLTSPTIPLKRKSPSSSSSAPPVSASTAFRPSTSSSTIRGEGDDVDTAGASDAIRCICGFSFDDGFSIACDICSRWVHAACFDIVQGEVPEEWRCWVCEPRKVDKERAVRLQKARQRLMNGGGVDAAAARNGRRRVNSPGVERKRRASAVAADVVTTATAPNGTKRRRRYSVNTHPHQHAHQHHPSQPVNGSNNNGGEDEHVDIDEPMSVSHTYIHIEHDLVPHQPTRDKLKRLAQNWRGVTAIDDDSPPSSTPTNTTTTPVLLTPSAFHSPPPTSLRPVPPTAFQHPTLSSHTTPAVRPPSYAVHTTRPVSSEALIAPYASTIVPSTVYLADPLNSYAHLGMPRPFVHLLGPPLDLALDARLAGNGARFVRSGCRPNAVLRPVICQGREGKQEKEEEEEKESLAFGVFALRDLKANEEVVLGWEWDDGSVVHHLPALIDCPHLFACVRPLSPYISELTITMIVGLHVLNTLGTK